MDKQLTNSKLKDTRMGAAQKVANADVGDISETLAFLKDAAAITERELTGYLDIAPRTLQNWLNNMPTTAENGKALRLVRLKQVVQQAIESSLPNAQIKQLLVAPLDESDVEQKSILHFIREEANSAYFSQVLALLISSFRDRRSENPTFKLSENDFRRVKSQLEQPAQPTEYLKKVTTKHRAIRK